MWQITQNQENCKNEDGHVYVYHIGKTAYAYKEMCDNHTQWHCFFETIWDHFRIISELHRH